MYKFADLIRALPADEVRAQLATTLSSSVTKLPGVTESMAEVLRNMDIQTVFDLATSRYFQTASLICNLDLPKNEAFKRYGLPRDLVKGGREGEAVMVDKDEEIWRLVGVTRKTAITIKEEFGIGTIAQLASWAPYKTAEAILHKSLETEEEHDNSTESFLPDDPEYPKDLVPVSGDYPTEKLYYSVMFLDEITSDEADRQEEVRKPIDFTEVRKRADGYNRPAFGALVTYEQAWFTLGTALGNLLHSVALAPGESTRIAMINWDRLDSSQLTEELTSIEQLSNITSQNRAMGEVQKAVASDTQNGFSSAVNRNEANSYSAQRTKAETGGVNFLIGGYQNTTVNSTASNSASSLGVATSVSSSSGRRDLAASMSQNIAASTQQHASAMRTQRASVITETIQSEDESITTRMVTNYNHMHALTIQYYEVVQAYRVVTSVSDVQKLIYLPMKVISDWTFDLVERLRSVLIRSALNRELQLALLGDPGRIWIQPSNIVASLDELNLVHGLETERTQTNLWLGYTGQDSIIDSIFLKPEDAKIYGFVFRERGGGDQFESVTFHFRDGSHRKFKAISGNDGWGINYFHIGAVPGKIVNPEEATLDAGEISQIEVVYGDNSPELGAVVKLELLFFTTWFWGGKENQKPNRTLPIYIKVDENNSYSEDEKTHVVFCSVHKVWGTNAILNHLNLNAFYYSQAVWANMDESERAFLLSEYSLNGRPLLEQIDGSPVGLYANYLIYRMNGDEEWENKWKAEHGFNDDGVTKQDVVPLSSGGVFAEAVLGRANSAEKLDMTRFWNWQDSPIPLVAPEIAPVSSGSRFQDVEADAGQFAQPMVNIVNPQPLPDPTGVGAIINALTASNMFRDMSGGTQNISAAQAATQAAFNAATAAGDQAQANLAQTTMANLEAYKAQMEAAKAGVSMAMAAMGVPVPMGGKNISNTGAVLNQAEKLDRKAQIQQGFSPGIENNGGVSSGSSSGAATDANSQSSGEGLRSDTPSGRQSASDGQSLQEDVLKHSYDRGAAAKAIMVAAQPPEYLRSEQPVPSPTPIVYVDQSVGESGLNHPSDVKRVHDRLHDLGFTWAGLNEDGTPDPEMIIAIKLFQGITDGIAGDWSGRDGRVDPKGPAERWLQAANAPSWLQLDIESPSLGYVYVVLSESSTDDRFCTSWMQDLLYKAGRRYFSVAQEHPLTIPPLTIYELSAPKGLYSGSHVGHKTGMNFDMSLPKKDGTVRTRVTETEYSRETTRLMLNALHGIPEYSGLIRIILDDDQLVEEGLCIHSAVEPNDRNHYDHIHVRLKPPPQGPIEYIKGASSQEITRI